MIGLSHQFNGSPPDRPRSFRFEAFSQSDAGILDFILVRHGRAIPPSIRITVITAVKIVAACWPLASPRTVKSPFSAGPRVPMAYRRMPTPMMLPMDAIALYPRTMRECEGTEGIMCSAAICKDIIPAAAAVRIKKAALNL